MEQSNERKEAQGEKVEAQIIMKKKTDEKLSMEYRKLKYK